MCGHFNWTGVPLYENPGLGTGLVVLILEQLRGSIIHEIRFVYANKNRF